MKENNLILEAFPDFIQSRIEMKNRLVSNNVPNYINDFSRQLVLDDLRLWRIGTLRVSFKGGSPDLHQKIANIASVWSNFGNIKFDFGYDEISKKYRSWTNLDTSHIRISFEYNGYWSLVGTDSADHDIIKPGEITMNLSNFDQELPENFEGIILHEFGHALGFHHEHQSPALECDFDWPKIYNYLGGPPNYWPKHKVDHNLRQLRTGEYTYSAHDSKSIMHYSFPSWMFIQKENSPCHTLENNDLSQEDKIMAKKAYPTNKLDISGKDTFRINNLTSILNSIPESNPLKEFHQKTLNFYNQLKI